MQKTVGLVELQQQFDTIFDEVAYQNIPYILTRDSQPQVVLIPYKTFHHFQTSQAITFDEAMQRYLMGNYRLARVIDIQGNLRWHFVELTNGQQIPLVLEPDEETAKIDPWDDETHPMLHRDLNRWLPKLSPEVRWQIAMDLYKADEISSGRAAEIAGLNYFVFEEKLRESDIPFNAAVSTTPQEKSRRKALIYEITNLYKP